MYEGVGGCAGEGGDADVVGGGVEGRGRRECYGGHGGHGGDAWKDGT